MKKEAKKITLEELKELAPIGTKVKSKVSIVIRVGEVVGYFEKNGLVGLKCKIIDGEPKYLHGIEKMHFSEIEIIN